jgi:hypothetical protein
MRDDLSCDGRLRKTCDIDDVIVFIAAFFERRVTHRV